MERLVLQTEVVVGGVDLCRLVQSIEPLLCLCRVTHLCHCRGGTENFFRRGGLREKCVDSPPTILTLIAIKHCLSPNLRSSSGRRSTEARGFLRAVGLRGAKAASIVDLAAKTADGTVPLDHLDELPDAEIVRRLEVWPADDHGVRHGVAVIHALPAPPAPEAFEAMGDSDRPYRSVAAWSCWRAVDIVLPT